jgi:hypothetical protein
MFRKLIAGTAVAGALTFGAAGLAGAATTPTGGTGAAGTGTPSSALCARLPQIQARVTTFESVVATRLPKAESREAKSKAAGHTEVADRIAARITRVQDRESKLNARLAKAEARCGSTGSPATS